MKEGILAAADAVRRETGQRQSNVLGYCVGGTLLASTLAYLAARGQEPFKSATFLAAQVDFTKAGDLKLFIDEAQLKSIEEMMAERGYLDGSRMATVFNMLRPRDLIWPYIINNYMLGKKPFPFDLLFWNQDSTRMPAANHNFYLREFYHENRLAKGEMTLAGTRLDLKRVKLPIYELAAREDHIAPAQSVFIGSRLFGGPVDYVMSGSGHIAGVINPPGAKAKYQYWTSAKRCDTFERFVETADGASRLLVAALDQVAGRALRRQDRGAHARRQARRRSRTRPAATSGRSRRPCRPTGGIAPCGPSTGACLAPPRSRSIGLCQRCCWRLRSGSLRSHRVTSTAHRWQPAR